MAIHVQEELHLQKGHLKSIDEAGIMMVFDTLQKYQYSYPIKSTVRELLSNAIDSVSEKKVAKQILTGTAKVEDFFVEMDGPLYKDSHFDPDYYDLKWLSNDDTVLMSYVMGGVMEKDKVIFKDYGVGLGGKRLEGYFKLAYSTKRLSKLPLGKFGLGAKAPISITEPYTMESRYNGKLFRFNIYSSKVDSIIPRMNLETGKENEFVYFGEIRHERNEEGEMEEIDDRYQVYYLPTEEKNGVSIIIEAKKHHQSQYMDAVKSQMLYFDNIRVVLDNGGVMTNVPYKATILYEDDMIVMSDNNYYSKPHLLLNKVNYGYIAWDELELEEKHGNIGIKVAPEDVEVNPSRESVLWTEKTKDQVLKRFNEVVDIAAKMIQEELKATDFLEWLKTCYSVYNKYSERGGIIGRLSKIVDIGRAKFKFNPNPDIIFDSADPMGGLYVRHVEVKTESGPNKVNKKKVIRDQVLSMGNRLGEPVFLMGMDERANNRRDKWLYQQYPYGFLTIKEPYQTLEQAEKAGASEEEVKRMHKAKPSERFSYWEAVVASAGVTWYKDIEVPEDFTGNDEDVEEVELEKEATKEEKKQVEVAKLTAEQRRKQNGTVLIHTMESFRGVHKVTDDVKKIAPYSFIKREIPISSINDWDAKEVYYGMDADSELLTFVAMLTRDPAPGNIPGNPIRMHALNAETWMKMKWWRKNREMVAKLLGGRDDSHGAIAYGMQHFFDTDLVLVKISQAGQKYFRDFDHVQQFFITIHNKTITMSNKLIKWNTARLVKASLAPCAFLHNFPFHPDYADMYAKLCSYVEKNYREVQVFASQNNYYGLTTETYSDMVTHLDNVKKFQDFVARAPNDHENIAKLAGQMFGNKDLRDGMAVEPSIMQDLSELLEYARTCGGLLNQLPVLTGYSGSAPADYVPGTGRSRNTISEELEQEIRTYLESRGALQVVTRKQLMELPEDIKNEILDTLYS